MTASDGSPGAGEPVLVSLRSPGVRAGCQLGCCPWWSRAARGGAGGPKEGLLRSCVLSLLHSRGQSQVPDPPGSRGREADPPLRGRCCRESVAALNLCQFDERDEGTNLKIAVRFNTACRSGSLTS